MAELVLLANHGHIAVGSDIVSVSYNVSWVVFQPLGNSRAFANAAGVTIYGINEIP